MDARMSTHQKPGISQAPPGFRRRVIFELTIEELPLLDQAQARHGTKRQALLAALHADQRIQELEAAATQANQAAQTAQAKVSKTQGQGQKSEAKLRSELTAAQKTLAARERELAAVKDQAASRRRAGQDAEAEQRALEQAIEERDELIDELSDRAADQLFCARCDTWAAPDTWAWKPSQSGRYAYHHPCGDHAPGLLGSSSWLAHQGT